LPDFSAEDGMSRHLQFAIWFAFLVGTQSANAAPGLKEKDEGDLKKLQGDWVIESWIQLGQNSRVTGDWSFKDDKYSLNQSGNLEEGTIKLASGKKPATIDMTITGGNCKGNDQLGIYKIEGDTLTLCLAWPGATERPTEFGSTREARTLLITLKRAKK
jgi:uncharacterized protein (TIGR03067 family)